MPVDFNDIANNISKDAKIDEQDRTLDEFIRECKENGAEGITALAASTASSLVLEIHTHVSQLMLEKIKDPALSKLFKAMDDRQRMMVMHIAAIAYGPALVKLTTARLKAAAEKKTPAAEAVVLDTTMMLLLARQVAGAVADDAADALKKVIDLGDSTSKFGPDQVGSIDTGNGQILIRPIEK